MKKIVKANQAAWEEAFERRATGFGNDHAKRLAAEPFAFLDGPALEALRGMKLEGACVGQFCCNNGRELMSVVKNFHAREGVGFDIAGNILAQARGIAAETGVPCVFVQGDVCEAPAEYDGRFHLLLVTAGALCWQEDLRAFFRRAAGCLRPGGTLLVYEIHPFTNMLALPGEEEYDAGRPDRLANSYFRTEPFIDCYGMPYLTGQTYESKPFTSFVHTMGDVVTAVARSGLNVEKLAEYEGDIGALTDGLDGKGLPLSYLLTARKA